MSIKVLVNTISDTEFQDILEYYNLHKSENEYPLQILDRAEGGFKIDLPQNKWKINHILNYSDDNDKIRQVRWKRGYLFSGLYIGFTKKQYKLLYEALAFVLKHNVIFEDSFEEEEEE
jgi:hypothetical protein